MKIILLLLALLLATPVYATVPDVFSRDETLGNGVNTVFTYSFKITDQTHIDVYVANVLQVLGLHYSVSGVGTATGGTITFVTPPANGARVVLLRDQPLGQTSDYQRLEPFPAERIELDFDKRVMAEQMLEERINRAVKLAPGSSLSTVTIGDPGASQFIRWNAAGTALEAADLPTLTGAAVSALASYAKADLPSGAATGTLARVTDNERGIWMKLAHGWVSVTFRYIDVTHFGAVGDGSTDDFTAFQTAFDTVASGGRIVIPGTTATWKIYDEMVIDMASRFGFTIECAGRYTVIESGIPSGTFLYINDNTGFPNRQADKITLKNCWFEGSGTEDVMVRIDFPFQATIEDITIQNTSGTLLYVGRPQASTFQGIHLRGVSLATTCLHISEAAGGGSGQGSVFFNNLVKSCDTGIIVDNGSEHILRDLTIESNVTIGIDIQRARVGLFGSNFEDNPTHLRIGDAATTVEGVIVKYNTFDMDSGSVLVENHDTVTMSENVFFGPGAGGSVVTLGAPKGGKVSVFSHNQGPNFADLVVTANEGKWIIEDHILEAGATRTYTMPANDTTPSVAGFQSFLTANTVSTTITKVDNCYGGKTFSLLIGDNNTILQHNVNFILLGSQDITPVSGDRFMFHCTQTAAGSAPTARMLSKMDGSTYRTILHAQEVLIADAGVGVTPYTLIPTRNLIELTCADADGCLITMGETTAISSEIIIIYNSGSNTVTIDHAAGITQLAGAADVALGQWDNITLIYRSSRWIQIGYSNN